MSRSLRSAASAKRKQRANARSFVPQQCCVKKGAAMRFAKAIGSGVLALITILVLRAAGDAGEKKNPCTTPTPRMKKDNDKKDVPDAGWIKRHEGFVEIA